VRRLVGAFIELSAARFARDQSADKSAHSKETLVN